jgi:hypothetical protein
MIEPSSTKPLGEIMSPSNQHEQDTQLGPTEATQAAAVSRVDAAVAAGRPSWAVVARGAKIMALQAKQARQVGMYQQALDILSQAERPMRFRDFEPDMGNRLLKALFDAGREATADMLAQADAVILANPGKPLGARR